MLIKVTRSGPRRYVQLVEAYRDDAGQPRQRTVATLGRLDQMGGELESVISGLMRVTGKSQPQAALTPAPAPLVAFEPARDYGDVWTLTELWNSLGVDRLRKVFLRTCHAIDVEALVRVMVINRLCDPHSKLGGWRQLPWPALDAGAKRDGRIQELEKQAALWAGKLDDQDAGKPRRGRKLSDGGASARFYHEVCDAHLARIVRVDLKSELFTYSIDERALQHARLMDGKLLLVTNTPDLAPAEVIRRYKSLADIERGFRVLKSEIEIGPIYHRLPDRIRAHATICFMALVLYRVMRTRLRQSDTPLSPERALDKLRRIQHQRVTINAQPVAGLSSITQEHAGILSALTIKKPTLETQLTLL